MQTPDTTLYHFPPTPQRGQPAESLSVVVPVHNEAGAVGALTERIAAAVAPLARRRELLFIDDGSSDGTAEAVRELRTRHPEVRLVSLSRNFGKELAISAGLDLAEGQAVVVMDGDLQHPPEAIPEFFARWLAGIDLVYGVDFRKLQERNFRGRARGAFYRVFNAFSDVRIPAGAGDFVLMDRAVVRALRSLPERNRFSKGLMAWVGFSSQGVPFEVAERRQGRSKWSLWALWRLAMSGLTAFTSVPLKMWLFLGVIVALGSMLFGLYTVLQKLFFGIDAQGYATIIAVMTFLGGIQLISIGIVGEYISRLFDEAKGRPRYIVRRMEGFEETGGVAADGAGREKRREKAPAGPGTKPDPESVS